MPSPPWVAMLVIVALTCGTPVVGQESSGPTRVWVGAGLGEGGGGNATAGLAFTGSMLHGRMYRGGIGYVAVSTGLSFGAMDLCPDGFVTFNPRATFTGVGLFVPLGWMP